MENRDYVMTGNDGAQDIAIDGIPETPGLAIGIENAEKKLFVRLSDLEANGDGLKDVPHRTFAGDLALTAHILLSNDGGKQASLRVTYDVLKRLNMTEDELFDTAIENARSIKPMELMAIGSVLINMMGEDAVDDMLGTAEPAVPMIVANAADSLNGAAVMAYPDFMDKAAGAVGSDEFWIIPSSIHEVLLVPSGTASAGDLAAMIRDVNSTQVAPDEVLSWHPYYCDGHTISAVTI